ncbi:MAG: hypothetical protein HYT40_02665 [Candidatus Sungbacteria bacterium]|uniref:Uncharacterized protein n=1 Tax=Candidatus Sungiibacteriota bacterium TaxID=2750080 RepID=A0A931WNV0_9BACT|nr:hypothetical protein [Candidatus Sungbacteria bacterium]
MSMTKIQKTLLVIIAIGVVGLATARVWLPRVGILYGLYSARREKWLDAVPIKREIPTPQEIPGSTELSYQGLTFRIPWGDVVSHTEGQTLTAGSQESSSSLVMASEVNLRDNMLAKTPEDFKTIEALYGKEATRSNYAVFKSVMHSTPAALSIFSSSRNSLPQLILVTLKRALVLNAGEGLYEFETPAIKGFQFGDAESRYISITFFDKDDKTYRLNIRGASPKYLDYILSSIENGR